MRRADGRQQLAYLLAFTLLLGTILTFVGPPTAQANHPSGTCLDVFDDDGGDEVDVNPTGTLHTLTAQLRVSGP
ncbi:MAG: hypothetical protein M3161_04910, partial [Actinomycetota bacterium]|nr:hypothetical protein [Actinomycetota bacterium]